MIKIKKISVSKLLHVLNFLKILSNFCSCYVYRQIERLRGEIRSSVLTLDLKDGNLQDSGKEEEGKTFHKLHVIGTNDDLWDKIRGLDSETWKRCECL